MEKNQLKDLKLIYAVQQRPKQTGWTGVEFPNVPGKFCGKEEAKSFSKTQEGGNVEEFRMFL